MESNWRYNVWKLGLGGTNITLAARYLSAPEYGICNWVDFLPNQWRFIQNFGGDRGWDYAPFIQTGPGHFPHGYGPQMEPDTPV